jgi:S-DNA-T family DNA segregation ATPase FtsK/SpoIIIE
MSGKNNRLKSDASANESKASEKAPKNKRTGLLDALRSERFVKISSLFLLLFSLFLAFSFASHLFNWRHDFDKVNDIPWYTLLADPDNSVNNRMGEIGALTAFVFLHQWFGISAFLIPFFLFIASFRMFFEVQLLPIGKTFLHGLFVIIFLPVALALVLNDDVYYGGFGYTLCTYLQSIAGTPGTVLILVFVLMAFLMLAYNFRFALPELSLPAKSPKQKVEPAVKSGNALRNVPVEDNDDDDDDGDDDTAEGDSNDVVETGELIDFEVKGSAASNSGGGGMVPELEINLPEIEPEPELVAEPERPEVLETKSTLEGLSEEEKERMNLTDVLAENENFDLGEYDPTKDLSNYQYPDPELLENHGSNKTRVDKAELEANSNRIIDTLKSYGIDIAKISASIGPTVTLYEIIPAAGVRISKIKNLEDDIALSLSALGIRIIAPMPGKGTIGIEVPNQNPEVVAMKTLITSEKFTTTTMDLPVALGKTISNENFVADLAKMPHLLMAGATGQGKSVGLNAILVSLLYKKHPSQIKFVLVDPKKVELTLFNKIERHFLAKLPNNEEAIITDVKKVVYTLNSLCVLMDQRYELLKMAMVRNLKEYNAKFLSRKLNPKNGHHFMPYIVLVVDEFADLIMTAGKEVELPIARLAQLARAIGIHLIIATQRPSVNIITGTIKANFPARVAFRVTSKIDSRTILDSGGADQLIGRGDLLFSTGSDLIRLQCPFVDTPEVDRICDFIGSQQGYPSAFILPEYVDENADPEEDFDIGDRDSMFDEAAHIVVMHQQGSASLLQRKLKLGYNRAGRIIDQLEKAGIIGPFEGSKARKVLFKDVVSLEQFLKGQNE